MASTMLGTVEVPSKLWAAAKLIGKIPAFASQSDPRVSYCMYIPPAHYRIQPDGKKLSLIVNVHGSSRRAETCRDTLIGLADSEGVAVLAPLFPAGIDGPNDSQGYKFVSAGSPSARTRYDRALLSILDEVAVRWPSIEVSKFFLVGYSGGGQFVLRFLYLYPEKLAAVSIGAPGTVTHLDESVAWPWGIQDVDQYFDGQTVDLAALAAVPHVQLLVGGDDVSDANDALWRLMPASMLGFKSVQPAEPPKRLPNRLDAVKELHHELGAHGIRSELLIVPGIAHSSDKLAPHLIR